MSATVKCPMLGEWMWPGSIYDRGADGAEKVMERAARIGMTDVFLLVKGLNGSVCYNRGVVPLHRAYPDRDILQVRFGGGQSSCCRN